MGIVKTLISGGDDYAPMQTATPEQIKAANEASNLAIQQQQAFAQAVGAQGGLQKQLDQYNQFGNIAAGQGPNPAQNMLNQATGQNVANQAALMASQRGAGANVGLMARNAAQQGSAIQQNAVGQAATMQAQQALAAQQAQANMANQMAAQQANAQGAYTNAALGQQSNVMGAAGQYNQQQAQMRQAQLQMQGNVLGGVAGAVGTGMMMAAEGGPVAKSHVAQYFANGGSVPALVSPGEKYLSPSDVKRVEQGANPMNVGETIPGKPKVGGATNSYANDTVKKTLKEGGIVIPRSVTQAKNPDKAAEAFVNAILARKGKGLKK